MQSIYWLRIIEKDSTAGEKLCSHFDYIHIFGLKEVMLGGYFNRAPTNISVTTVKINNEPTAICYHRDAKDQNSDFS